MITIDTTGEKYNVGFIKSPSNKDTTVNKRLVVLDGKLMTWKEFEKMDVKPQKIKSINVLKGESAITKYGQKGKNGVIEITTGAADEKGSSVKINIQDQPEFDKVFTKVETPPYYQNGMMAFADYINRNIQYPTDAIQSKIEGAVTIQFIVSGEGELTDFKKGSAKGYGLEEEAIRLIKNSGKWKPGVQNGRKVPVQIVQQVIFELPQKL